MTLRRFLFWIHLTAGCLAGLVIFVMSVTGVLLAYKRQVINFADRSFRSQPAAGAQPLTADDLLAKFTAAEGRSPSAITIRSDSSAPAAFDLGRERTLFLDAYTGKVLGEESLRLRAFFSRAEDLHRWLGVSAEKRQAGRAVTGACTLIFLVLVTSGPFLWWPKEWTWNNLKKITLPRGGPWIRARDWNWHNTLGFWCVLPLFLIVITGVIMSYAWANNLLYRTTGNPPPQNLAAPENRLERESRQGRKQSKTQATESSNPFALENLLARAKQQVPGWTTIIVRLPENRPNTLTFSIDQGNGGRPDLRSQLTLDTATGAVVRWEPFSSYNRGRQLRAWARFTHTGEALGVFGETIAVLATAGASLLVFTGLSLALRRLAGWKASVFRGATVQAGRSYHRPCGADTPVRRL